MKTVHLTGNKVSEIIPIDALPVNEWYNAVFASECREAPDEVEQNWYYNSMSNTFSANPISEETEKTDIWDEMVAAITEGVNEI